MNSNTNISGWRIDLTEVLLIEAVQMHITIENQVLIIGQMETVGMVVELEHLQKNKKNNIG